MELTNEAEYGYGGENLHGNLHGVVNVIGARAGKGGKQDRNEANSRVA